MSKNIHLIPIPLPATVPALKLPPELERAIEGMQPIRYPGSDQDPGLLIDGNAPRYHPDAERYAREAAALLEPASLAVIDEWLSKLGAGVGNRPEETVFKGRLAALVIACGRLPKGVWSDETLEAALLRFSFFASVSEIGELLQPYARRLRRAHDALRKMAEANPEPAPEPVRPPPPLAPVAEVPRPSVFTPQAPVRTPEQQMAALGFRPGDVVVVRSLPVDGEAEFRSWFAG